MTRWIRNLNFSTKLVVIMVAGLVPVVLLSALYLTQKQREIAGAERELLAAQRYENIEALLSPVGVHEVESIATLLGQGAPDRLQAPVNELARLMSQHVPYIDGDGSAADEESAHWDAVRYAWGRILAAKPSSVADVIRLHSELRRKILEYRDYLGFTSGLLLESNPDTFYMIDVVLYQIPNYEIDVAELRAHAIDAATGGKVGMNDVEQITRAEVLAQESLDLAGDDLRRATDGGALRTLRAGTDQALTQLHAGLDGFKRYLRERVLSGSAQESLDTVMQNAAALTAPVSGLTDSMQRGAERQLQQSIDQLRLTRDRLLLLVALAAVAGIGMMTLVILTTVRGMNEVVGVVSRLADGDYTQAISSQGRDELARAMHALQAMQLKLRAVLIDVTDAATTVATGVRQINSGISDLSVRTEQQAASLEETASSMEEMTATVKQNADNAILANKLAQAARDQAEHGGGVVERAVAAMGAIDGSSKRIADIISVIDEIAFQTNLLALNAAVEAARAGEQGRGFAVVASEVRSLAQRSASAAKEIKDLIHDSLTKVAEGSRLVSESGRHLGEIVAAVKKVSDVVGEISNASQEQTSSAEEISRAVLQMDEGTQQNAAMVEETSAAATSMQDQATRLAELTAFFRLADAQRPDSLPEGQRPAPTVEAGRLHPQVRAGAAAARASVTMRDGGHGTAPRPRGRMQLARARPRGLVARSGVPGQFRGSDEHTDLAAGEGSPPPAVGGDWSEF
jgi:methyl-accepting chemotaxis protein